MVSLPVIRSFKTRVTLVTTGVFLLGLWALAWGVSVWQLADLESTLGANQFSTAAIAADEAGDALDERTRALESVAVRITPALMADPPALQRFLADKPVLEVLFNGGYYTTGIDGTANASIPVGAGRIGLNYLFRNHVAQTLGQGKAAISDVVVGLALKTPVFSIAVPVLAPGGRVIGCLVGVTDLSRPNFLSGINRHAVGRTGGLLLVSRAQRLIITATDPKRIMEKLPAPGAIPGIDRFLDGEEGWAVVTNPLGVRVLTAAKQIPNVGWYVAAATPTAEAFQLVADLQGRLLLLTTLLALATGLLNWLVLRRQLSPVLATVRTLTALADSDQPFHPLPVGRHDEVGDLIGAFNRLLEAREKREAERTRLEALAHRNQRLEAVGLLAGGIAHDFNNLLAGIFGHLELARLKAAEGPAIPHLDKTLATLGRARALTQQLLTFAKGGEPELKAGVLFPFVEETARFALSGSPVSCQVDVEPGLWACRFDRNQLGQVIDNLVINAVQAMPGGGVITITARNQGEAGGSRTVRVTVADNGPGMAPEVLAHLFEPFFTTKAQGHGLGLTTCYSILRRHGGTIEAESEVGRGTRFHVILPAAQEAEVPGPPAAAPGHRGSGTVLVMDDEPDVREILRELLESFGYRVVEAASGEEAVAAVRQAPESFAAIILDLTVPGGMGGTEALGQIRTFAPRVPVLVASGYSDATTLTDPKAFGFAAGLRKPYLKTELEAVFSALVRSGNDNS